MRNPFLPLVALLTAPLFAQSNSVPGMDALVYNVTDIAQYGRRGPAYPNGEVGLVIGHSYCNGGTVNIPWVATSGGVMVDTYPKIAFLLARESGGRMVQVSGRSFLKHSTAVYNFSSGPCAPCNNTGGAYMFVGCSDTYSSGINSNRLYMGPTDEIDPWLGTWNPVGSYFDRGDPAVTGPAATDRVKSLTSSMVSAFDPVKNRMEVRESELAVGGTFYTQVHLMIQGEPVANRGNNIQHRPATITWNGSSWNTTVTGAATDGSVLTRWSGASHDIGGNGNDDGRFLVAVKVTGPVGGMFHYEYAVHNLDNARGGAALRIPVDPAATVTNAGFRDIDGNALNEWTFTRSGSEIAFAAAAGNSLDWNTLYNFWFDCSQAPSFGVVRMDQARVGPGALTVDINSEVPSGVPSARVTSVGQSCGSCDSSFYEYFGSPASFDLANNGMTLSLAGGAYTVGAGTGSYVTPTGAALPLGDDSEATVALPFSLPYPGGSTTQIRVCSNGFISPAGSNGTTFTPSVGDFLGGQPRWAAAWHDFNPNSGGQVIVDSSPAMVRVTWLNVANFSGGGQNTFQYQFLPSGTVHILWRAMTLSGNAYLVGWTPGGGASDPGSLDISAALASPFHLCASSVGALSLTASARPILGTAPSLITSGIPAGTGFGVMVLSTIQAVPAVNLTQYGMENCFAHTVGGVNEFFLAPGSSHQRALAIPNQPVYIGLPVVAQTYTYSPPLTTLGLIASNGLVLTVGVQ